MKVAFITPTPMLEEFATRSQYHLVLAHIYEVDAEYRKFYKERVAAGDFVILDNSAYELQESVAVERLLQCALDLNPTAVFLPDCRFNTERTIELAEEAYKVLGGHSWKLFGVPQGNDLSSILKCYHWFANQTWIDGFGLYEEIGEVAGLGTRKDFLQYISEHDYIFSDKHYHLLGMEEDLTQIEALGKFPWVSGIDSAKAVVYGLSGIWLDATGTEEAYPHRPEGYFQISDRSQEDCIYNNISQVLEWAGESLILDN